MAAIYGMGDDVWSGPDWFADPVTPERARTLAAEHGIDLFAENADPPPPVGGRPSIDSAPNRCLAASDLPKLSSNP